MLDNFFVFFLNKMADKMEQNQEIQTLDQQDQTDPTTFKLQVIFPNNSSLPFTVTKTLLIKLIN